MAIANGLPQLLKRKIKQTKGLLVSEQMIFDNQRIPVKKVKI